jgi:hypothetical protein
MQWWIPKQTPMKFYIVASIPFSGLMTKVILSGQIDIDIMSIYLYSTVRTGAGEYHLRKNRDNDV